MSETVIIAENISKQYRLGLTGTGTLSHDLKRWWHLVRGKEDPYLKIGEANDRSKKSESQFVWSLKDINFEVKRGEVLGIIGRNGAGKSTLLKILSKVTSPTTGQVKIKGRIASLLEVGTGFHPELTGRENVFMNGAILGMNRREIRNKFDEIVEFSGVERYVDTPVKRYSSGMYVRLAFAVAAHLEPEILVVDEVLAVGDAEFQKKCLGKMQDVAGHGRTVLFVSHNMGAVKSLCNSGLFLDKGTVASFDRNIEDTVNKYIHQFSEASGVHVSQRNDRQGNGNLRVVEFELLNSINNSEIESGKQIGFRMRYKASLKSFAVRICVSINSNSGCIIFMESTTIEDFPVYLAQNGSIEIKLSKEFGLPKGQYFVNIAIFVNGTMADYVKEAIVFNVLDGIFYKNGSIPTGKSLCYVQQRWKYIDE